LGDAPNNIIELSPAEMQRLVASANMLQPLGKADEVWEAPDGCFQSGPNLYCADTYELATVPVNDCSSAFNAGFVHSSAICQER